MGVKRIYFILSWFSDDAYNEYNYENKPCIRAEDSLDIRHWNVRSLIYESFTAAVLITTVVISLIALRLMPSR